MDMQRLDPVTLLHAETPLRVWSLIVTVFGDAVMNRGARVDPPAVWTADLLALLTLLGIEPGIARTNLSRLVANGTLKRDKAGRNTFYRLSEASRTAFAKASGQIYERAPAAPTGRFALAITERAENRAEARATLETDGWRFISPTIALRPGHENEPASRLPGGTIRAEADATPELIAAAREAWQIDDLNRGYRRFLTAFAPALSGDPPDPTHAITLRTVAVHFFRRLALRDPALPRQSLPDDWAGHDARALFVALMQHLQPASEAWLTGHRFRD